MGRQMTVTLDEDVVAKLEGEAERTGTPAQDIVNETMRRALPAAKVLRRPFKVRPRNFGSMAGLDLNCTERLLDQIEGPTRK